MRLNAVDASEVSSSFQLPSLPHISYYSRLPLPLPPPSSLLPAPPSCSSSSSASLTAARPPLSSLTHLDDSTSLLVSGSYFTAFFGVGFGMARSLYIFYA